MSKNPLQFIDEVRQEVSKVTWPTWKEVWVTTIMVLIMVALASEHPEYGWDENKGYSTPAHLDALRRLGPCAHHRRTWRLPAPEEAAVEGERSWGASG